MVAKMEWSKGLVNSPMRLMRYFLFFSFFSLSFIGLPEPPAPGVVALFSFNEGSGSSTSDGSGNGHSGALVNSPAWTPGKYGQAIDFDGTNDYVELADHADFTLDPSSSYTWSAWVKNDNFNQWSTVWSQTIDVNNFFYFYAHTNGDAHGGPVTNGVTVFWWTSGGNKLEAVSTNNVLSAGTWSYITVTYDASLPQATRFSIYVNGADVTNRADVASSGTLTTINPTSVRVGANQPFGEYFNGSIDEVRYYQRLLSPAEIISDMNEGGATDTEAPVVTLTAPLGGTVSGTINITADATDNTGVAGVQFQLDGVNVGAEDQVAPYSLTWNTTTSTNGNHTITAIARDAAGNTTSSSNVQVTVSNFTATDLVAAYGFNENSGLTVNDNSGNGNNGALANGPLWSATGRFGSALQFDGVDDLVNIADANSLDLTNGMTLEAWVNPSDLVGYKTILCKDRNTTAFNYLLSANNNAANVNNQKPNSRIRVGTTNKTVTGTSKIPLNEWTHVACTYNGIAFILFVNGVQVSSVAVTGSIGVSDDLLRIGGSTALGSQYFEGLIDEVRIYNRALSASEIQADMNTPIAPDGVAPIVAITSPSPGDVSGTINITADATDNTGVAGVQFQLDGVDLGAEDLDAPYSISWNTTTATNGNHNLRAIARDAAGNITISSTVIVNVNNVVDVTPPTVTITAPTDGATVAGTINVNATATDDVNVVGVQFRLDGVNLGTEDLVAPYSVNWSTITSSNGSHTLTAIARDAAGNTTTSSNVIVTVSNASSSLVAAFGFNENAGLVATDNSGRGNNGTLANGPIWSTGGKYGPAIMFDGINDLVNIADAPSLDLTNGMTLEAWVNPTDLTSYKTIICKDRNTNSFTYLLSANNNAANVNNQKPNSRIRVGSSNRTVTGTSKLPLNTWTHVACTYNGSAFILFINGVQVSTVAGTGNITATSNPLRIGGSTALLNQYFAGLIDEVRIYNRALSASEIQADMITPIGADEINPVVSLTAPAAGAVTGTVDVAANATDNVAIAGVQFLLNGANLGAEDLVAPYSFSWNTLTAANGTYTLTARARDASGNTSLSQEVIVNVANDTELPTVSIITPTGGTVNGTIDVSADATDNIGVVGVQFMIDGVNLGSEDLTSPYTISWNTTSIADGLHQITALARDAAGNVRTSSTIEVNVLNNPVDTEAPVVSVTFPSPGEVSGQINITASATDNVGIAGVQFLVNGVNQGAEDLTFPYLASWNTNLVPNGNYTLTAKARDAAGNITTSVEVVVTVNNITDTDAPVITITNPASGTVSGTVNVNGNATDNIGVVGVQFLLNGANLGVEDLVAPYSVSWNTLLTPNGSYVITARARDAAGNTAVSSELNVTVSNVSGLIAGYPLNETSGTVATDISGNNHAGTLVNAPARIAGKYDQGLSFDGTNDYLHVPDHNDFTLNPLQNYTWSGWVRNNNFTQWSTIWSQTVDANNFFYFYGHSSNDGDAGPVTNGVSVYWWTNGGTNRLVVHSTNNVLTAGEWSHIAITYNGSAAIANRFTIYINGVDVTNRTDVSSAGTLGPLNPTNIRMGGNQPFGEYLNGSVDEFRYYQRLLSPAEIATDMNTPLGIDDISPIVTIGTPAAGAEVHGKVMLTANATDNVGVAGVQFLVDGIEVGTEDLSAPFAVEWNSEEYAVGAHQVSARARDAAGNITTSAVVDVTIVPNFTFTLLTPNRNVESSGMTDFRVYVSYNNGFTAPAGIQLSVSGLPANTTHHFLFNPMSHQGETQLYVTTSGSPFGSYPITLTATGGGFTHTQEGMLNVTPAADFALLASPSIQNVSVGAATTYAISLLETNDYTSPVNLSVLGLPAGVTATFTNSSPVPATTVTLTLTTTGITPIGTYDLTVQGESNSLIRTVPITLTVSSSASLWTVNSIGTTGVPNNTVRVGALRTDGQERVYVGTIATGRMLEYTWNGATWDGPIDIGGSPTGIEIHDCNIGPGRGDGKDRLYAASYDFNIYEIWHDETGWHQLTMGNVGNNLGMHMDIGDGRNDGVTRVYAASTQQLFEFTWNGTSWTKLLIGSTPGAHGVAVGKGRNDGKNYIYIASISSGNFEAVWNGTSWTISSMGDAGDARGIGLGDGRNDGITRVYSAIYDGRMREFTWTGSNWTFVNMPSTGTQNIHAYIIPGRNDGVNRLYTDNGNGKVWEYSWTVTGWVTYNMGGGSDYMYGLHYGRGRNDGILRLYSADRGSVNRVYEFTWTTPPPISFLRKHKPKYSIWTLN